MFIRFLGPTAIRIGGPATVTRILIAKQSEDYDCYKKPERQGDTLQELATATGNKKSSHGTR
jgi:hypothetical protein